jgi:hypothetical protein
MKVETIRAIEHQAKNLLPIVTSMEKTFNGGLEFKVIQLALSNIALNTEDCENYSIQRDIERINNTLELFKLMLNRNESHSSISYILEQFIFDIEGNLMLEDCEDSI